VPAKTDGIGEVVMLPRPVPTTRNALTATQTADIRALFGAGADEDRVATAHFLAGSLFLALAGVLQLLALFASGTSSPSASGGWSRWRIWP
jgi:hypothetical protein